MIVTEGAIERMRDLVAARAPFLHQGRSFQGIDCVGALVYAFQYPEDVPAYSEDPVNGELERELRRIIGEPILYRHSLLDAPIDVSQLQPMDVVSMQYKGPVRHVAMIALYPDQRNCPGQLSVIHTDAMLGRVTEHILDGKWVRRIVGVWRP